MKWFTENIDPYLDITLFWFLENIRKRKCNCWRGVLYKQFFFLFVSVSITYSSKQTKVDLEKVDTLMWLTGAVAL